MYRFKKKDRVEIISGAEKGKKGEIKEVIKGKNKIVVMGVNLQSHHRRPTKEKPGGIHKVEGPIDASNVKLVCPKCDKGVKVRFTKMQTGDKVRVCKKCGEVIL